MGKIRLNPPAEDDGWYRSGGVWKVSVWSKTLKALKNIEYISYCLGFRGMGSQNAEKTLAFDHFLEKNKKELSQNGRDIEP